MNGHIVFANGTEEGSLITFQCDPGFTLYSSSNTSQCRSGQWSVRPEDVTCTKDTKSENECEILRLYNGVYKHKRH